MRRLKDRIAFDYVNVPPETTKFEMKFFQVNGRGRRERRKLQGNEIRRRKNLPIEYNV